MKKINYITLFFMTAICMLGCGKTKLVVCYDNVPIIEKNAIIPMYEVNKIYQIYDNGFGGKQVFDYLNKEHHIVFKNSIDDAFLYTCFKIENSKLLYVFIEKGRTVSYLILRDIELYLQIEDFETLENSKSTFDDVLIIDVNTQYNIFNSDISGQITRHFLKNNQVLDIYYSCDSMQEIVKMECLPIESSFEYIKQLQEIDWQ